MPDPTYILADIGGTNARFAYGGAAGIHAISQRSYRNADFTRFDDALATFLDECPPPTLAGGCFAVAGPVAGHAARLTNRNWLIDTQQAARAANAPSIRLINDLSALARSTACLSNDQVQVVRGKPAGQSNGQSLVLGLGTGVNIATRIGTSVLAAEIGHSALPRHMTELLEQTTNQPVPPDTTVEHILSGRGFEALYQSLSGKTLGGVDIAALAQAGTDETALKTRGLYQRLTALYLRDLAFHYMPKDGLFLAGSVARSLLSDIPVWQLLFALDQDGPLDTVLRDIPVSLITDDAAALSGCLETAKNPA